MADTTKQDEQKVREAKEAVRYRSMTLEFEASRMEARADKSDTTIPVAISSESPVERYDWWTDERYMEVLDHSKDAVDLTYAKDGLPFLLDHDTRVQVGILENVRLEDKKLRADIRMGNHPDAGWVEKDIRAGVRKKVSVGYRLGEYRIEKEEFDGLPVRRYRWKPMEGSSVPIPADYDGAGIGRSAPKTEKPGPIVIPVRFEIDEVSKETVERAVAALSEKPQDVPDSRAADPNPAPVAEENSMAEQVPAAPVTPVAVAGEDRNRVAAEISKIANAHGMSDRLPQWLAEGRSVEQVKADILDAKIAGARSVPAPGHLDLSERDAATYNVTRAMNALVNQRWEQDGGFEKEISDTIAKRVSKNTAGFFIPLDMKVRASVTGQTAGTSSLGGAAVQTTVLSLIDLLRNRMQVRSLGATILTGLNGNITFPRQITANTFNWTGENPSSANTLGKATLDNVTLSPKTGMVSTAYSRQLLVQNSFDTAAWVMNDLATVTALGIDLAAIDGTGSASQPTGVMRQTGVSSISHGTDGAIPTWAKLVEYETTVAQNNADVDRMAWLISAKMRGVLKTTLKSTTAGSAYLFSDDGTIAGYRAEVSNQVPDNYTAGTSTTIASGIVFGNWAELLVGEWGGAMEIIVDPYTLAGQNMVAVTGNVMVDVAVKHPKAFAFTKSALTA